MNSLQVDTFRLNDHAKRKFDSSGQKSTEVVTKKVRDYIFKFNDVVGKGSFSTVYRGHHQTTHKPVAIKVVELRKMNSSTLNQLLTSEIETIQGMNHPNIVHCYDVYFSALNCYIVTEYCNGGDLKSYLSKVGPLDEKRASKIILEVYQGLKYLGERSIIHRDFKAANVLMNDEQIKIADFGFAKKSRQNFKDINIGSPLCMSPEGIIDGIYGPKTDVWAFGIFIYELMHGRNPFHYCEAQSDLKQAILQPITASDLKPSISPELKALIIACLQIDPHKRISMKEIQKSDYFARLRQQMRKAEGIETIEQDSFDGKQGSIISTEVPTVQKGPQIILHKMLHVNEMTLNRKANASKQARQNRSLNSRNETISKFKMTSPKDSKNFTYSKKQFTTTDILKNDKPRMSQTSLNRLYSGRGRLDNGRNYREGLNRFSCNTKDSLQSQLRTQVRKQENLVSDVSQLHDLVALVHYCRMVFKTIKTCEKSVLIDIKSLCGWLFQMLSDVQESIDRMQNPSLNIQQLKRIASEYQHKYSNELVFTTRGYSTFEGIRSIILQALKVLRNQSMSSRKEGNEPYSHMAYLLELTELLQYSITTRDYEHFTLNNDIEGFLAGKAPRSKVLVKY